MTILVSIYVYNTTFRGRKWVKSCTRFRSFAGRYSSAMCIWSRDETDTNREIWTSIILCYTHGNFTIELFKLRTILFGTEVFTLTGHWVIINIVFVQSLMVIEFYRLSGNVVKLVKFFNDRKTRFNNLCWSPSTQLTSKHDICDV